MEGWLKKDAVAWCRRTMAEQRTNIMISGLVQMYPGNIVESVCAMGAMRTILSARHTIRPR